MEQLTSAFHLSQASLCGICGRQSDAGTGFCASTSASPVSVIPPLLLALSLVYRGQQVMLATDSVLRYNLTSTILSIALPKLRMPRHNRPFSRSQRQNLRRSLSSGHQTARASALVQHQDSDARGVSGLWVQSKGGGDVRASLWRSQSFLSYSRNCQHLTKLSIP